MSPPTSSCSSSSSSSSVPSPSPPSPSPARQVASPSATAVAAALWVYGSGLPDVNGLYFEVSSSSSSSVLGSDCFRHVHRNKYRVERQLGRSNKSTKCSSGWVFCDGKTPMFGLRSAARIPPLHGYRSLLEDSKSAAPPQLATFGTKVEACATFAAAVLTQAEELLQTGKESEATDLLEEVFLCLELCSGRFEAKHQTSEFQSVLSKAFELRARGLLLARCRRRRQAGRGGTTRTDTCDGAGHRGEVAVAAACHGSEEDGEEEEAEEEEEARRRSCRAALVDAVFALVVASDEAAAEDEGKHDLVRRCSQLAWGLPEERQGSFARAARDMGSNLLDPLSTMSTRGVDAWLRAVEEVIHSDSLLGDARTPCHEEPNKVTPLGKPSRGKAVKVTSSSSKRVSARRHRGFARWIGFPNASPIEDDMDLDSWAQLFASKLSDLNWSFIARRLGVGAEVRLLQGSGSGSVSDVCSSSNNNSNNNNTDDQRATAEVVENGCCEIRADENHKQNELNNGDNLGDDKKADTIVDNSGHFAEGKLKMKGLPKGDQVVLALLEHYEQEGAQEDEVDEAARTGIDRHIDRAAAQVDAAKCLPWERVVWDKTCFWPRTEEQVLEEPVATVPAASCQLPSRSDEALQGPRGPLWRTLRIDEAASKAAYEAGVMDVNLIGYPSPMQVK